MIQQITLRFVAGGLAHILSDVLQYASQTVVAGTLRTSWMGLFTAWPGFSIGLLMSQLTEPTFGGYARQPVVWGDEGIDMASRPSVLGGLLEFQPTDSSASDTIIGAFLADAETVGNLIAVGLLPQQKTLGTPLDLLGLVPRFSVPGSDAKDWGEIAAVS